MQITNLWKPKADILVTCGLSLAANMKQLRVENNEFVPSVESGIERASHF